MINDNDDDDEDDDADDTTKGNMMGWDGMNGWCRTMGEERRGEEMTQSNLLLWCFATFLFLLLFGLGTS